MSEAKDVIVHQPNQITSITDLKPAMNAVERYGELYSTAKKLLKEGIDRDYAKIPGTQKKTLLQAGAQKLNAAYGIYPEYEVLPSSIRDHETPFYHFDVLCRLYHQGVQLGSGIGSANSKESRYRYRWVKAEDIKNSPEFEHLNIKNLKKRTNKWGTQFRVENDDIHDLVNTIVKIAKKRSYVDATLSTLGISGEFTQDMEEYQDSAPPPRPAPKNTRQRQQQQETAPPDEHYGAPGEIFGSCTDVAEQAFKAWSKCLVGDHTLADIKERLCQMVTDQYSSDYWDMPDDMAPELKAFLRSSVGPALIADSIIEKPVE